MKKFMKIIPLGGVGKIGYRNCTIYENQDSIIIVDMGLAFPETDTPGIDFSIVDPNYLEKNRKKIKAIIITHGHYDHIGGLVHLWKKFPVKMYLAPFSMEVIKIQFEFKKAKPYAEHEFIEFGKTYNVSPDFTFEFVQVMHSVPETAGIYFNINGKKIFHLSDFRLDKERVLPEATDYKRLMEIGNDKLDLFLTDSTSVFSEEDITEQKVMDNTEQLFMEAEANKQRIFICCFSTNVSRMLMTLKLAEKYGRRVVMLGYSIQKMLEGAVNVGLIEASLVEKVLINVDQTKKMADGKLVYLGTGSQGEPMAAMARLARGENRFVELKDNDMIIHSATPIPGNEESVWNMFEMMAERGAVIRSRHNGYKIHASGHASRSDLIEMFKILRPKVIVPVHGTAQHMKEVERVIESETNSAPCYISYREYIQIGEENVLEVHDFDEDPTLAETGEFAIDGDWEVPYEDYFIFRQRKFMHEEGAVFISIALNRAGMIVSQPSITTKGLGPDEKLEPICTYAMANIFKQMKANGMDKAIKDEEKAKEIIRIAGRRAFVSHRGKKPMTVVNFVRI
tara:strand:+ start:1238 stop:2935 length:1698 start_codon:yes stop_codon:yes gene_type:complete